MMHLLPTLGTRVGHDAEPTLRIRVAALLQGQFGCQRHDLAEQRSMFRAHMGH